MKILTLAIIIVALTINAYSQQLNNSEENLRSLQKQLSALTIAFANGDAAMVASLHHPDIAKIFRRQ